MPRKHRTDFNDLLVDSVDEAISEVLGNKVTAAFWYHYQAFLGITRDEMPYRLDTLFASLKGTFGVGGETLGRVIVKKMYAKANVPLDLKVNRSLAEHVEELKRLLAEDLMQPQPPDENGNQQPRDSGRNVLAVQSPSENPGRMLRWRQFFHEGTPKSSEHVATEARTLRRYECWEVLTTIRRSE